MRRAVLFVAATATIASLVLLERASPGEPPMVEAVADFPAPGSLAPDFTLPILRAESPFVGTETVRLSDYAGRYVYLDVFGSWCIPCRNKYPSMFDITAEVEEAGGAILGLLLEDSPQKAAEFFSQNGGQAYPFVIVDDETARAWGLTGAPMGFLISPDGRVERLCFGCNRGRSRVETVPEAVRAGLADR